MDIDRMKSERMARDIARIRDAEADWFLWPLAIIMFLIVFVIVEIIV